MSDDDLICICMSVTRGEIKNAIQQGHETIDALKSTVLCCTGCGTCEGRVTAILEEQLGQSSPQEETRASLPKTGS